MSIAVRIQSKMLRITRAVVESSSEFIMFASPIECVELHASICRMKQCAAGNSVEYVDVNASTGVKFV